MAGQLCIWQPAKDTWTVSSFCSNSAGCQTNPRTDGENEPIDEAESFGHMQVVEYLNNYALARKTETENEENEVKEENTDSREVVETAGRTPLP